MFNLWIGSAIAALVVGVFVWGLIFWCIIRYRKRGDELPAQTRYNLPIELIYSVAPFLIISVLFYYTAIVQTDVNQISAQPGRRRSTSSAFKWNWKFTYPGTDGPGRQPGLHGRHRATTSRCWCVPTNKRIRFVEHSPDVIHSFWVPELLFKRDVFPGNVVNTVRDHDPARRARYVGRCAELCGTYHSMMNFELRAVTPEKYDAVHRRQGGRARRTPEALAVDRRGSRYADHDRRRSRPSAPPNREQLRQHAMKTEYKFFGDHHRVPVRRRAPSTAGGPTTSSAGRLRASSGSASSRWSCPACCA